MLLSLVYCLSFVARERRADGEQRDEVESSLLSVQKSERWNVTMRLTHRRALRVDGVMRPNQTIPRGN